MTDWLGTDHVVWFLIDVVARMDLTALFERAALCRDGQQTRNTAGRAAYNPEMLLALLIYGYACGERSSRQIERLCHTDIAFRLICAGDIPDHTVIARFRKTHTAAFAELFTEVLLLCKAAGLVKLCTVAIDGSKIAGNASKQANRSEEWLRTEAAKATDSAGTDSAGTDSAGTDSAGTDSAGTNSAGTNSDGWFTELVGQVLAEAEDTDAAEDGAHGETRGDELPPGWNRRHAERHARIEAGLARIDAAKQAKEADRAAAAAERARCDAEALAVAEQALATEMRTRLDAQHTWEQQWEHANANPGAPVPRGRAPKPAEESGTVVRARARVDKARHRVDHPDTAPRPGGRTPDPDRRGRRDRDPEPRANLTDPDSTIMPTKDGWIQGYNTQFSITRRPDHPGHPGQHQPRRHRQLRHHGPSHRTRRGHSRGPRRSRHPAVRHRLHQHPHPHRARTEPTHGPGQIALGGVFPILLTPD